MCAQCFSTKVLQFNTAGGRAVVKQGITAKTIGSAVSTPTELYVGYEPEKIKMYQELVDEYTNAKKRYDEISLAVNSLKERKSLKEHKKKSFLKMLRSKFLLKERLKELRKEFDNILPEMETNNGVIKVSVIIHYGVKALIGNAVIYIRDDLTNCVLTNVNGKISIGVNS